MGIAGYILGGALQGLGQGMALKQKSEDEDRRAELAERRQQALLNLQHSNAMARDAKQNDYNAQDDQRDQANTLARDDKNFQRQAGLAQAGAAADAAEKQKDRDFRAGQAALEREFKLKEIAASTQARIREFNATYRDEITTTKVDDATGTVFGITKSGKAINLTEQQGVIARPAPKASSGNPDWLNTTPGQGPAKPNTKPIQIGRDANGNLIWPE